MLCVCLRETDPAFNLAAEEHLFSNYEDDIFMLWRNRQSIIVGKHQNTNAEINIDFVRENGIPVIRRMSGGGAVFHDLGNVNYTFITTSGEKMAIDFRRFTEPILEVLRELGVDARFEGRNDLTIGGSKFSGNAQYIRRRRILHHGTLLFSSVMNDLASALKVNPLKYRDKSVKSVRSRVTNISEHLDKGISVTDFIERIMDHIIRTNENTERYELGQRDIEAISGLREKKYATWEWNYGESPDYSFRKVSRTGGGNIEVMLDVQEGTICGVKIYGDFFGIRDISDIEERLVGVKHERKAIGMRIQELRMEDYVAGSTREEFVDAMF